MAVRSAAGSAWVPCGLWVLVIFALSSIPDLDAPDVGLPRVDKLAHLGEYAVLGILQARARGGRGPAVRAAVAGGLVGVVVGGLDELYQTRTPGRESSVWDALADVLGAGLGSLAWWIWRRRRA